MNASPYLLSLRLACAEVPDYFVCFKSKLLAAVLPPAVQRHSIARLNACRAAGQRITPLVFFIRHTHPVCPRVDTACNSLGLMVCDQKGYDYHDGHSRNHNSDHDFLADSLQTAVQPQPRFICPGGRGERHTKNHNQNCTPPCNPNRGLSAQVGVASAT